MILKETEPELFVEGKKVQPVVKRGDTDGGIPAEINNGIRI